MTKSETGGTFDPTKPFKASDGREVTDVTHTDGYIRGRVGGTSHTWFSITGTNYFFQTTSLDLINIPEPPANVPSEGEVTRVEEAAADPENRFRGRHQNVPSKDGESDADFVERMSKAWSNHEILQQKPDGSRLIAIARRAVFPPDASTLEIVCRAICKFEGRDPDLTGDSADAGAPKDQPRWRLEEGLAGAILTALHLGSPGSYAEPLWRARAEACLCPVHNDGSRADSAENGACIICGKSFEDIQFQPDAYRAGLMRGAGIADLIEKRAADRRNKGVNDEMYWGESVGAARVAQSIRAEAAAFPPDLTTPYTPRIVDLPDGTSEFMLEDVPCFWSGREALAQDDDRFVGVRWPTRELPGKQEGDERRGPCSTCGFQVVTSTAELPVEAPQPDAMPEPVAWQWRAYASASEGGWRTVARKEVADANAKRYDIEGEVRPLYAYLAESAVPVAWQHQLPKECAGRWCNSLPTEAACRLRAQVYEDNGSGPLAVRPLYAAPPAPVPAGEVTEEIIGSLSEDNNNWYDEQGWLSNRFEKIAQSCAEAIRCPSSFGTFYGALESAASLIYELYVMRGSSTAQPRADAGEVTEALQWYAENVAGCRKLGSIGDPFRQALDADGGGRARAALAAREAKP